jgi:hypothetical protein
MHARSDKIMKLYDLDNGPWHDKIEAYPELGEIRDGDVSGFDGLIEIEGVYYSVSRVQNGALGVRKANHISLKGLPHNGMHQITCPYCSCEDQNSWEALDSEDDRVCGRCNAVFSMEREVYVTYDTKPVTPPEVTKTQWVN